MAKQPAKITLSPSRDIPFDQLKIGMPLQMVLEPFSTDSDGNAVYTYAFAPAQEA